MATLMTLPRELRDEICTYVILGPIDNPQSLVISHQRRCAGFSSTVHKDSKTAQDRFTFCTNLTSLLLISHQLHAETTENLIHMTESRVYDMEINHNFAAPRSSIMTWLRVPMRTTSVDRLNVFVRVPSPKELQLSEDNWTARDRYSLTSANTRFLAGILFQFFEKGPHIQIALRNRRITVKTLDINVKTPPGYNMAGLEGYRALKELFDRRLCSVSRPFSYIFNSLYEYVGEIVIRLDGMEQTRYDLTKTLSKWGDLAPDHPTWGILAETRRKNGLPVIEDQPR